MRNKKYRRWLLIPSRFLPPTATDSLQLTSDTNPIPRLSSARRKRNFSQPRSPYHHRLAPTMTDNDPLAGQTPEAAAAMGLGVWYANGSLVPGNPLMIIENFLTAFGPILFLELASGDKQPLQQARRPRLACWPPWDRVQQSSCPWTSICR